MSKIWLVFLLLMFCFSAQAQKAERAFPQHVRYFAGCIKPDNLSQNQLDQATVLFYTAWKDHFIKSIPRKRQSYIWFENKDGKQSVSEGQGYGMVIVALMAGFDRSAKTTFDNLYRYYRAHSSNRGGYLMAWAQTSQDKDLDKTSASDGDIDIAYSLLLANSQWGSKGAINYLQEAKNIIGDIMQYEINHKTWSVLLSNAIEHDSKDYYDTRSSDFAPANFKAFEQTTGDVRWKKVIDKEYKIFARFQQRYSPDAGLVSDFIVQLNREPKPAPAHYLESVHDGEYNYNACRVPWRIATDYLLTGDERSKIFVQKINYWIRETTNNDTYNLSAGYTLAGNDIKGRYFEALSFVTPFGVSAMVDKENQQWLNRLWKYTVAFKLKDFDYYDNTIKMLNLIILSGNYWKP